MVNSCVHQMSGATGSTKCWSVEVEQLLEGLCVISIRRSVKDFTRDWCERLQTHSLDFCVLWQLTINKIILILIFTFFYVLTLNQTLVESILHVYLKKNAWFINRFYIGGQHFGQKQKTKTTTVFLSGFRAFLRSEMKFSKRIVPHSFEQVGIALEHSSNRLCTFVFSYITSC